jgi:hypothetical protein
MPSARLQAGRRAASSIAAQNVLAGILIPVPRAIERLKMSDQPTPAYHRLTAAIAESTGAGRKCRNEIAVNSSGSTRRGALMKNSRWEKIRIGRDVAPAAALNR